MFRQTFYGGLHYIFKSPKGQLEFHYYLLILYSVKFREFIARVSFITRVLNFAIF